MSVLVTVGTTSFDSLIAEVDKPEVQSFLHSLGYSQIICQIGSGRYIPSTSNFRFLASMNQFISDSDLVISHAGAGTILDVLRSHKKLIVVVNPSLMNNHQLEIAETLSKSNYLLMCRSPSELIECLESLSSFHPADLPAANTEGFKANMLKLISDS